MEEVNLSEDWVVELNEPQCDLKYDSCQETATKAYRVHDCGFYYACEPCAGKMLATILKSFHKFKSMQCKNCSMKYQLNGYMEIIELQGVK